ncbi:VirB8/TrbF family protein [Candidatus Mesenet endosymbiont of Agriotes lineatus]|uniref:VirB8/TrbF family protein n=1 Tax=Candidatus Mesenet endosymbiont of Agriotes lineatus TaxID=3077948 RepID=UPI0030CFBB98
MIKRSKYLDDAIEWYCYKYLFCITERAWLILMITFTSLCLCTVLLNLYLLFPLKKDFIFVKYTERNSDEFTVLKKLSFSNEEKEQVSLSRYLVGKYVETYESYDYDNLEYQVNFIENNSARKVYLNFKKNMNSASMTSPILKYRLGTKRVITVQSIKLSFDPLAYSSNAIVTFKAQEMNKEAVINTTFNSVELTFTLSNIKVSAAGVIPLKFTVNEYQSIQTIVAER